MIATSSGHTPPADSDRGLPVEDDSPSRRFSSSGINRNKFAQPQSLHRTNSAFYVGRIRGDNLCPGNLRWEGRPWRLRVLVSGLPEDCPRTEGRVKNSNGSSSFLFTNLNRPHIIN